MFDFSAKDPFYRFNLLIEVAGELDLSFQNLLVNCHGVIVVKWIDSSNHLVGQNAQGPPVDGLAVALVEQHLRGKVFWSATEGVSACLTVFGKSEICQFQVSFLIDQDVLRF